MFVQEEMNRYSRQLMLPELGIQGQEKLKQARVLVIGAGGLGCPVLLYLAAAGAGTLGIVDDDTVDESNLQRQVLYTTADVGRGKAAAAKARLQALNPYVCITAYPGRLTEQNVQALFAGYDLVVDGSDNFSTRYLVNDACTALGKPLVFGAVHRFEGQVSVFNYRGGPSYRDLFPAAQAGGGFPACSESGVIGVLPGMVGTFMANEAIKIICGIGETLSGRLLSVDALGASVQAFKLGKAAQAGLEHAYRADTAGGIDREQLKALLAEAPERVLLVDVRDAAEFEQRNIGGINIPLYELPARIGELEQGKEIVFCCQAGYKSRQAVLLLQQQAQRKALHLEGGIYTT